MVQDTIKLMTWEIKAHNSELIRNLYSPWYHLLAFIFRNVSHNWNVKYTANDNSNITRATRTISRSIDGMVMTGRLLCGQIEGKPVKHREALAYWKPGPVPLDWSGPKVGVASIWRQLRFWTRSHTLTWLGKFLR